MSLCHSRAARDDRCLACQGLGERFEQLVLSHGLRQILVDAGFIGQLCFVTACERSQHYHFHAGQMGVAAQRRRHRQAVHDRHLHIDDGNVERCVGARGGAHQFQGGGAMVGSGNVHLDCPQLHFKNAAIGRVILDQDDAPAAQLLQVHWRCNGRGIATRQRNVEAERRAFTELTFDADRASHQLDQLLADREPESGAPVTARHRLVSLHEHGEKPLQRFCAQADAGIAHLETDPVAAIFGFGADGDDDLAGFGEFQCVADQVGQHLADARRISLRYGRHFGPNARSKLDPLLMRSRRQHLEHVLDHRAQIEIDRFELELAGLDLREIQNVVDDFEQRFARAIHRIGKAALLVRQCSAKQQLGHPQHTVHRGANLVAHIGQELRLRAAGGLGDLLRVAQHALAFLGVGDVLEHR